jgi:MYXO-CTERM domain-containing protein
MDYNGVEHATVVSVEVGPSTLGNEPATTATLRDDHGKLHTVRILGGPNAHGGVTKLYGYVVPFAGDRVRLDLREEKPIGLGNAWVAEGPKWATFPVAFALAMPGSRDVGLEAGNEIDVAGRSWSTVKCTAFRATFSGTTMNPPGDDGVNGVYFHDVMWPTDLTPKGVAQTVVHMNASNQITDADIHVNGQDYTFSLQGGGAIPDVRAIVTHEMGHALGLGHSTVMGATMWATYPGGIAWRSLEQDDRDGVCALYPGMGAPGCDTTPCPGGFVCVANQCERKGALGEVCSPCKPMPGTCLGAGDDARCVDLPNGGHVCGRACTVDGDCGKNFHCKPTTTSGDLQCISDDGCASGPDTCTKDTDCTIANTVCKNGACADISTPGADAGTDGSADGGTISGAVAGCTCNSSSGSDGPSWAALLLAFAIWRTRVNKRG